MIKTGFFSRALLPVLTCMCVVFIPGCNNSGQEVSRYASIVIPEYDANDYYLLLSHRNPDIVYNAVCNLHNSAYSLAASLNEKTAKKTQAQMDAARVYEKMLQLLRFEDDKILAATLRFFQLFGPSYARKEELIRPLLAVKSKNINVQCEQIRALASIASKSSAIDPVFVRKALRSRSWLVSRSAYSLVDSMELEPVRQELIAGYSVAESPAEKLLILSTLKGGFSSRVFEFLAQEAISAKDAKIKRCIFKMLGNAQDTALVLKWVDQNYDRLAQDEVGVLAAGYEASFEEDFSSSLLAILIKHGYLPGKDFLKKINESIREYETDSGLTQEKKLKLGNLLKIRQELLSRGELKLQLEEFTKKAEADKNLQEEYTKGIKDFAFKADEILKKYKVDEKASQSFLDGIVASAANLGFELALPEADKNMLDELSKAADQYVLKADEVLTRYQVDGRTRKYLSYRPFVFIYMLPYDDGLAQNQEGGQEQK